MDPHSPPTDSSLRQTRQFSVRELLTLTFAVSLIFTIGVVSRGSPYFGAFSSWWALVSLIPLAVVLFGNRFRLLSPKWLAIGSVGLYLISLCVPAVGIKSWTSPAIVIGWAAFYITLISTPEAVAALFNTSEDHQMEAIAYLMGTAANVAFITGVVALLIASKKPAACKFSHRAAVIGAALAQLLLLPLALNGDLVAIYPGYGLWLAGFVALMLATGRLQRGHVPR